MVYSIIYRHKYHRHSNKNKRTAEPMVIIMENHMRKGVRPKDKTKEYPKENHESEIEIRANQFAAELLMPRELFLEQDKIAATCDENKEGDYLSFGALSVSLLKLPKIIANYLFNPEEGRDMVDVIKWIQDYDKAMYSKNRM